MRFAPKKRSAKDKGLRIKKKSRHRTHIVVVIPIVVVRVSVADIHVPRTPRAILTGNT